MRNVAVNTSMGCYDICIGAGAMQDNERLRLWCGRKAVLITDEHVMPLYADTMLSALRKAGIAAHCIAVPPGEESKSEEQLFRLYEGMLDIGLTRSDVVVALGGGVVGDLAGYAAATFLRGLPLIQVPTTLLAQVDSSVGGKVAVNLPRGKNLIGTFYQPVLVFADLDCLRTLDERQWKAGMAEVIKYGAIRDASLFRQLEQGESKTGMEELVARCCAIKADYVQRDPMDKGARMELNFGHTLGHAVETAAGYGTWLHGEAVAMGMAAASLWGERLGISPLGTAKRVRSLIERYDLPAEVPAELWSRLNSTMAMDKKSEGDDIHAVLLRDIGDAVLVRMPRGELERIIQEVRS